MAATARRQELEQTALEQIGGRERPAGSRRASFGWVEALGAVLWIGVVGMVGLIVWLAVRG